MSPTQNLLVHWLIGFRYDGYDKSIFGPFVDMGFDVSRVLAAFKYLGIPKDVDQLGPEMMEEVTERLLTGA